MMCVGRLLSDIKKLITLCGQLISCCDSRVHYGTEFTAVLGRAKITQQQRQSQREQLRCQQLRCQQLQLPLQQPSSTTTESAALASALELPPQEKSDTLNTTASNKTNFFISFCN